MEILVWGITDHKTFAQHNTRPNTHTEQITQFKRALPSLQFFLGLARAAAATQTDRRVTYTRQSPNS